MINKNNLRSVHKLFVLTFSLLVLASSCKKDPKPIPVDPTVITAPTTGTREELTKDSIYLYAKETYYWNDGIPSYDIFKPRSYATNEAVLDAIKILPGTNKPTDKYSFLDDGTVSAQLGGVSGDYGFSVFYNSENDLRIKYVSPNSPAAAKELKRGYKIIKLNGRTDLSSSNSATINFVGDAIFGNAQTVDLIVVKPDGSSQALTVARGNYSNNPIFYSHIYTLGSKKVAYIVYNSFTTTSRDALKEKFAEFATANVTELIVDLRYNGGGSVSTADVFTNLIAPSSAAGQVMYTTYWTKTMQDGNAKILSHQPLLDADGKLQPFTGGVNGVYATYADINYKPTKDAGNVEYFAKEGSANITKVSFLVLKGTASASELLMNNLKPVMPVKLIGQTTYGKPVGFFAIHIDKLDLYIPQFETKNQQNVGAYYSGMTPDFAVVDDVTKDFGDPQERLLAAALSYSEKGTFSLSTQDKTLSSIKGMSVTEAARISNELDKNIFKGMIDDKLKLKKQ